MNKKYSLTNGSILKGFINFAIPLFLGSLFQQLYGTVDLFLLEIFLVKMTQPLLAPVVFLLPA